MRASFLREAGGVCGGGGKRFGLELFPWWRGGKGEPVRKIFTVQGWVGPLWAAVQAKNNQVLKGTQGEKTLRDLGQGGGPKGTRVLGESRNGIIHKVTGTLKQLWSERRGGGQDVLPRHSAASRGTWGSPWPDKPSKKLHEGL